MRFEVGPAFVTLEFYRHSFYTSRASCLLSKDSILATGLFFFFPDSSLLIIFLTYLALAHAPSLKGETSSGMSP